MKNEFGQIIGDIVQDWQPRQMPTPKEIHGNLCTPLPLDINQHAKPLFDAFNWNNQGEITHIYRLGHLKITNPFCSS